MAYKVMELRIEGKIEKLINISKLKKDELNKLINQMGKFTSEVISKKTNDYELCIYATSGVNKLLMNNKLEDSQVMDAVNLLRRGYSMKSIAKQYKVTEFTLSRRIKELQNTF